MKVSVIIPTYKRSDFLIRAIESVYNQDYKDYGACFARNEGAKNSDSDILMFLDDDDYYYPNKISQQLIVLANPEIDACLCGMKRIDDSDFEIISKENFPRGNGLKSFILDGNCFTTMIAIRKKVFMEIGGFSEISRFQDKFFMYKFYENNKKDFLLQEQLFVLSEHLQDRISLGNINKISDAYYQLYDFEQKHFDFFSDSEIKLITDRFFLNLARIRVSGNFKQRIDGLKFLTKSKKINNKILIKLIFSDKIIKHLKRN